MAALAGVYLAAAWAVLGLGFAMNNITAISPPTGIALAVLLLRGPALWPGIAVGSFLANWLTHTPILPSVGVGLGDALECVAAVWLLRRFRISNSLDHSRDVAALLFAAVLFAPVSATVGTASLLAGGVIAAAGVQSRWLTWCFGDAAGVILVAPVVLTWFCRPRPLRGAAGPTERVALLATLAVVVLVVFGEGLPVSVCGFPGPRVGGAAQRNAHGGVGEPLDIGRERVFRGPLPAGRRAHGGQHLSRARLRRARGRHGADARRRRRRARGGARRGEAVAQPARSALLRDGGPGLRQGPRGPLPDGQSRGRRHPRRARAGHRRPDGPGAARARCVARGARRGPGRDRERPGAHARGAVSDARGRADLSDHARTLPRRRRARGRRRRHRARHHGAQAHRGPSPGFRREVPFARRKRGGLHLHVRRGRPLPLPQSVGSRVRCRQHDRHDGLRVFGSRAPRDRSAARSPRSSARGCRERTRSAAWASTAPRHGTGVPSRP